MDKGCVFVEMEQWQREFVHAHCRQCDQFRYYTRELDADLLGEIADARILSVFIYSRLTAQTIERLPRLRLIAARSTGFDHIDLAACRGRSATGR